MLRFTAIRRAARRNTTFILAFLALAGMVLGAGALTPSSARAYAASTSCAKKPANNAPSGANPILAEQSACVIQGTRTMPPMVRWTKVVKPVNQRAPVSKPVTPVSTPAPAPPPASGSSVAAMIQQVFGSYASGALNVARCESGLNPDAYNPTSIGGSHAEGVFQILYPSTWNTTPEAGSSPYNAMANIQAAHAIFVRDGYNFHEWSCQP